MNRLSSLITDWLIEVTKAGTARVPFDRREPDGLRGAPVRGGEQQHGLTVRHEGGHAVDVDGVEVPGRRGADDRRGRADVDAVGRRPGVGSLHQRAGRGRHGDPDVRRRGGGEAHADGVDGADRRAVGQAAHVAVATAVDDDHAALGRARHRRGHTRSDHRRVVDVRRAEEVVQRRRGTGRVAAQDVADDVTGDVDDVAAETADDEGDDARRRGQHVDRVVALERVHGDEAHRAVRDPEAGTVDRRLAEHEVVAELGRRDVEDVVPGAAVHRHRAVHRVAPGASRGQRGTRQAAGHGRVHEHPVGELGVEHQQVVADVDDDVGHPGRVVVGACVAQDDDLADLEAVVDEAATVGARDDRDLEDRVVDDLEVGAGQRSAREGDVEGPGGRERQHGDEVAGQGDGRSR
jgi:hypothetical protein